MPFEILYLKFVLYIYSDEYVSRNLYINMDYENYQGRSQGLNWGGTGRNVVPGPLIK